MGMSAGPPPGGDLGTEQLRHHLGARPFRTYPALLSTHAEALAWARAGGPAGAVVVADYQASPRGRAGLPWTVVPGSGLGCSLIVRPALPAAREGWLYTVATAALAEVLGAGARIEWPDEVLVNARRAAAVGVHAELGPAQKVLWGVVTLLVTRAAPPRGPLLTRVTEALEAALGSGEEDLRSRHRDRCRTLGRRVRARLIPLGPGGPQVAGAAVDLRLDGSLVIRVAEGRRVAVPPQNLGVLEPADGG
jgi:BirA family transcriptional regulator, biotin operon repressor / biotin---[acetyl-CoA-carboxylase] ligase